MKWLLITTAKRTPDTMGSNVGDEFAAIGVEKLINSVDTDAHIQFFNKEDPGAWDKGKQPERDRVVICGMPLFWSFHGENNIDHWWWDYMWNGWMTLEPRTVLALGVGHVVLDGKVSNPEKYQKGMKQALARSWRIVAREPITDAYPGIIDSICPSAWCLDGQPHERKYRLCNLMPGGGHFGYAIGGDDAWESKVQGISYALAAHDFLFVAHTLKESEYALAHGWPKERIRLFGNVWDYLKLYSSAACYFGNRQHGAAVCASTGVPTWAATHDSRLGMVERLGGIATLPEAVTPSRIKSWLENPPTPVIQNGFKPAQQWAKCRTLLQEFMLHP